MTPSAPPTVPQRKKLNRALASLFAFLQAMEATPLDDALDRLERLERQAQRREGDKPGLDENAAGRER